MFGLVFTLVSAILGVAMFGAILLAPAKSEASIASSESAGDGSTVVVATAKHRAFDGFAIDEIRLANSNVNGTTGGRQDSPAKPPRPSTDEPRTQVAQIAKTQMTWQMAAQIPNTQTLLRQM